MRADFDEDEFRKFVLREIELAATKHNQHRRNDDQRYRLYLGMIRGIRVVAQQLDIPGLQAEDLRDYETKLRDDYPDPEIEDFLDEDPG